MPWLDRDQKQAEAVGGRDRLLLVKDERDAAADGDAPEAGAPGVDHRPRADGGEVDPEVLAVLCGLDQDTAGVDADAAEAAAEGPHPGEHAVGALRALDSQDALARDDAGLAHVVRRKVREHREADRDGASLPRL